MKDRLHPERAGANPLQECVEAPNFLPPWVMPEARQRELLAQGHGIAPDIVYARGVPCMESPPSGTYTPHHRALLIIEVGYCQDFRLQDKAHLKLGKYDPLVAALKEKWGRVELIALPIGNGGTVSSKVLTELALALSLKRPNLFSQRNADTHTDQQQQEGRGEVDDRARRAAQKAVKTLGRRLRDLSQEHLIHILKVRSIRI